ncbi:MAG: flagellar biosynthesis protein FlhA [Holosporales bacterium]|jgi:flagellar biosynthesis protein FlhA|nr:flagellar biosynthesis protein FlhA [Holosporales bacterium]
MAQTASPPEYFSPKLLQLYTQSMIRLRDVGFAIGLVLILVTLILPMPRWLMDFALALSILFSVMILMTVLFIEKSLDFSVFPTVLLVSTILRLALNLASTRLILAHGHEGVHAAGEVIYAFGSFIMGGNFVIGVIVFAILIIVNFVVITKGSGRIAEVSARFTLDALPGKQMAIDADLSSGIINEKMARKRRKFLEDETNFYGSMDGAAKFVRGDAIAGVIITLINIIAGIIIGVAQKGITLQQASASYTLLTVGDGLVSQIPALIVSTAAGMLVSKSGVEGTTDKAFFGQLSEYPNALWMSAVLMVCLAMLPGIPKIPFLMFGTAVGYFAYKVSQTTAESKEGNDSDRDNAHTESEKGESLSDVMQVESLRLELGYGLLSFVNPEKGGMLEEQIKALRRRFAVDLGFLLPSVRIQDNTHLDAQSYIIKVKEIECGKGIIRPDRLMVIDPAGKLPTMKGEKAIEPTFGLPALWINASSRMEAESKGYTVIEPTTVLLTHLGEIIKENIAELFSCADMQRILNELPEAPKKLILNAIPTQISLSVLQRIFQALLEEGISIRDSTTIIESIAETCIYTHTVSGLLEQVRIRLSRQLCFSNLGTDGILSIVSLTPESESSLSAALIGEGENRQLALAPSYLQHFVKKLQQVFEPSNLSDTSPVFVVPGTLRMAVRSILERVKPDVVVLSQNEIHPKVKIRTVGYV